ncbi:FISUMP domain-containing protein [Fibrobacter sp. UBA4297]|uniref:FISUMP domain-containing protein n=2 Tax=Fibrobacter TaxID=832 RepID=UPI0025BD7427|nr:FISUMP domain-containing protein [Fibrobacter sp. UBA4297]
MRKFVRAMCHPGAQSAIGSIMVLLLTIALAACGGDSGTSANDDNVSSSSSSSVIPASSGNRPSSSSQKIASSSSVKKESSSSVKTASSSSSAIPASSGNLPSSSSKKEEPSSSEYVPFDHSKTLAEDWRVGENAYKQFTDPRNGRSYYYIKIIGKDYLGDKDSVTIMAENLNIGEMVQGKDDQKDDTKIERYCYNNDTTKCDEYGGLYQWAEMMLLPSRCNTESCSDLIQENHRGICPEGWRLMKDLDFYIAWHAETNEYGIEGVRSAYLFNGYNSSGLSLTGAGLRTAEGGFNGLREGAYWFLPEEFEKKKNTHAYAGFVSSLDDYAPSRNTNDSKKIGLSVRCVKVEQ